MFERERCRGTHYSHKVQLQTFTRTLSHTNTHQMLKKRFFTFFVNILLKYEPFYKKDLYLTIKNLSMCCPRLESETPSQLLGMSLENHVSKQRLELGLQAPPASTFLKGYQIRHFDVVNGWCVPCGR